MPDFAVILPAAGSSSRFGTNKLLADLAGKSVLLRSLEAFLCRADVRCIVIALRQRGECVAEASAGLRAALSDQRVRICEGGEVRAESVRRALAEIPEATEWVAVHDAARPLVEQELIDRTLEEAVRHGAAIPALPVSLTVKQADGPLPALGQGTVPRQRLWAVQTPQVMRRAALERAFAACPIPLAQITDDAQLLELAGESVWLVEGSQRNLKITTAMDLRIAALLCASTAYDNRSGA